MNHKRLERALRRYVAKIYNAASERTRERLRSQLHRAIFLRKDQAIVVWTKGVIFYEIIDLPATPSTLRRN